MLNEIRQLSHRHLMSFLTIHFGRAVSRKKILEGVLGTSRRRRQDRDAERVEGGGEWGGGVPLPSRLGGLGSVVSSPSGVRGGAPAENGFGALYSCQKAPHINHFEYFEVHVYH